MAREDLNFITGDVHGNAVQARDIHGNIYLNGAPPVTPPHCEPPANWASTTDLPAAIQGLLWAQEQSADLLPYQLPGARKPSLGTVYVRQDLGGGLEDAPAVHPGPTPIPDEHGRLVELPVVPSVRVAVRPPSKPMRAALDTNSHLLVLGGPGQGKSTLTLRLSADIARYWTLKTDDNAPLAEPVIPLRVTARTLAKHLGSSFTQALADSAFAEHGRYLSGPLDPALFSDRVAGCRWLLLVDALDEVAESALRATLVHTLSAWASRDVYRVLLTTRPTEGGALAPLQRAGAARYELQPFDGEALRRFAHNWFEEVGEEHADRFLHQVREAHLDELVEVPLLATIAAIVFEQYLHRPLPGNQYELYESYLAFIRSSRPAVETFERHRVELVEHLGRTRLTTDSSLAAAAQDWACRNDVPDIDRLVAYLLDVGPFVRRGNDIAFLHHSFAEHVAATSMARELPPEFAPQHDAFAERLYEAYPEEGGSFARAVLLHYTHLRAAEADRVLRWLHAGGSDEHLLAARLLARHLPTSVPVMDEFLVAARAWAMTTRYPARLILRETSRATRHPGLIEWLGDLMHTDTAPWESRAEAAVALAVRLPCARTDAALAFLRSAVDDRSASTDDRLTAAEALAHSGKSEQEVAERGLRSVLADQNASGADHRSAAVVLSAFDSATRAFAVAALERLVSDADTPSSDLVEAATGLMEIDAGFHDRCAEIFLEVLRDPADSFAGRYDATIGLASLGLREQAAEALTATITDPGFSSGVRASAAEAMATLGSQHRLAAGEHILSYLDGPAVDPIDQIILAPVLARLGCRERAVAVLREALSDPAMIWNHFNAAANSLASLGPAFREEAAAHFEHVLSHLPPKGYDYTYALRWLADLGEPHRGRALALMWGLLADPSADPETRCTVASNLVDLAPERHHDIVGHLMEITKTERNPSLLVSAWRDLLSLRPELCGQAKAALVLLVEQACDGSEAPFALGRAFGSFGVDDHPVIADLLVAVAHDESRGVRTRLAAVRGLCQLGRAFHRQAAELLGELVAADVPVYLGTAVLKFVEAGRGVRTVVAEALHSVLRSDHTTAVRAWAAVQALGTLGYQVSDDVLHRIVANESTHLWRRVECALLLADRDETHLQTAVNLHRRAAGKVVISLWQRHARRLARTGVDVRAQARALLSDPNASRGARTAAASLLGIEGIAELRDQVEDLYLDLEARSEAYRFLAAVDPAARVEAVAFHQAVMDDPDERIQIRCDMAAALVRLDRSFTSAAISALWRWAESPLLNAWERASAAIHLSNFDEPSSPRSVQLLIGLCRDPARFVGLRCELVRLLPRAQRTEIERALLADRSDELSDRIPERDVWGDMPLSQETEVVVREVLTDPASSRKERRQAAVELAELSGRHRPEAIAVLLADGSPAALAEVAKLGEWQRVLDYVLDETHPLRKRVATALRVRELSGKSAVRDMLTWQSQWSWRDQVDVLAYLENYHELRVLRDDRTRMPAQRWRAAGKLVELTPADRAAAARVYRQIATDQAVRPPLRQRAAEHLAKLGSRGRAEAASLMRATAADENLPAGTRSGAANWLRNHIPTCRADMLAIQRSLVPPLPPLRRVCLLRSVAWAPSWEAVDEMLRMAADRRMTPRVRLWCARSVVERRRDLKDRCSLVAREIAFDEEAPWHIRLRAAQQLAQWSAAMREDARGLVEKLSCAPPR